MRIGMIIVGIVLLGLGVWITMGNASYNDTDTKAKLGPVKVEATTQKSIPTPVGYAGIVIGGVLIIAGALRKSP